MTRQGRMVLWTTIMAIMFIADSLATAMVVVEYAIRNQTSWELWFSFVGTIVFDCISLWLIGEILKTFRDNRIPKWWVWMEEK